jgi:hypothetical protein
MWAMKRLLSLAFVCALTISTSAQWTNAPQGVPAFHPAPPLSSQKLPPILSGDQLKGPDFQYPFQAEAYRVAAKAHRILYQLPCYCYCDRSPAQHKSLRSCFESDHGAHCSVCMQEAFYAYQQSKRGKTARQIRMGVIKGEHRNIDLRVISAAD